MTTIKESELHQMFTTEEGGDLAIATYFEVHQIGPMAYEFRLRDDVTVIHDLEEPALEGAGNGIFGLANRWERSKRYLKYKRLRRKRPEAPRLVSEGDSWFQHPLIDDTIDHLYETYNVRSLGAAGDTLINIANQREYLWEIEQEKPVAFLLSGLGNDVMADFGKRLVDYFPDDGTGPRRLLRDDPTDPDSYTSQLRDGLARYESIAVEIGSRFPGLPIVVHGYDYVSPGEGKSGKWLQAPLTARHIPQSEQSAVMAVIIDDLDRELAALDSRYPWFHHARCLKSAAHPWYDEIHPTDAGFASVARKIDDVLRSI